MKSFALGFAACMTLVSALAWAAASTLDFDRLAGQIMVYVDREPARSGSGTLASVERALPDFDRIELRSAENLEVRIGPKAALKLSGDDNLLDLIETRVEAGKLLVDARGSYRTKTPIRVEVQLPRLAALELLGSADARIEGLAGGTLDLELNGSGSIEASGEVEDLDVEVNGSGDARLGQLKARKVEADLNGSGDILVFAVETLQADINGSGDIRYRGSPAKVESEVNGSGDVSRVD